MPEPFKNFINAKLVEDMAAHLSNHLDEDHVKPLILHVIPQLEHLELKERSQAITDALVEIMPKDFVAACDILKACLHPDEAVDLSNMIGQEEGLRGWAIMPIADYVAEAGQDNLPQSFDMLEALTSRFSAEFAIRSFIRDHMDECFNQLNLWAQSDNEHVRRLASEGSRPRLPWGIRLHALVDDPSPLFPLLEQLMNDPSEYVRRSVANNLNDIAKDHPDAVLDFTEKWMKGADKNRRRLLNHACRTLFKQGNQRCLTLFGFGQLEVEDISIHLEKDRIKLGETIDFNVSFHSSSKCDVQIMVDYAIHFMKANGQTKPKVFKWTKQTLKAGEAFSKSKSQAIKHVTTRAHYPGLHHVEILVNGQSLGQQDFILAIEE